MMKYTVLILSLFFSVAGFGQGQMFLRATAAAAGNLLLDDYPGAAVAYAVMKLDNDYAGSCIRIRRDSDNAEQDIGFSGNDIDEASINSFCSGANCFVKTWYDQSGNGNNATQTTTANQPKIYDSSTGIVRENSVLALQANGSNTLVASAVYTGIEHSTFTVSNFSTATSFEMLLTQSTGGSTDGSIEIRRNGVTTGTQYIDGVTVIAGSATLGAQSLLSGIRESTGLDVSLFKNGSFTASSTSGANGAIALQLYVFSRGGSFYFNGTSQLILIYNSDQSANRTAIEAIINNYFSIY